MNLKESLEELWRKAPCWRVIFLSALLASFFAVKASIMNYKISMVPSYSPPPVSLNQQSSSQQSIQPVQAAPPPPLKIAPSRSADDVKIENATSHQEFGTFKEKESSNPQSSTRRQ